MNLTQELMTRLNLQENVAQGLAGQTLMLVEDLVRERVSYGVASKIRNGVPELIEWQSSAPTLAPGQLTVADLLPSASPPGDESEMLAVLNRFRVDPRQLAVVTSLAYQFLKHRLDETVLETITKAVPVLLRAPA